MSELTNFPPEALLQASLDVALAPVVGPLVLAVSGGRDSMVLLQAIARWAPGRIAAVATFDHGTGSHATEAASLVAAESRRLGLTVVRERSRTPGHSEAAWRTARWDFLGRIGRAYGARIATAHTRDDQLETVFMRLLRGAGTRGMAALAAPSRVVRPWLGVTRAELTRWAVLEKVAYLDDPMNASRTFLRGRVRHELLPALEAAAPGFSHQLLEIADRAALWRRDVERLVDEAGVQVSASGERAVFPAAALEAAGLVMGIMIIPFVSSMADDSIAAVPQAMRDGSLAMGATTSETIRKVIVPAALPGIVGGVLLAVSRAIGETMIVVMAAGLAANLTANPFASVTTVTTQIVQLLTGDNEFDSAKTLAAFALGLVLFIVTLLLNIVALRVVKKYREAYD